MKDAGPSRQVEHQVLDANQVRAIAEQYVRREMEERHSFTDQSAEVESVEIEFKRVQQQRLSYLVQVIATETLSRWVVMKRKGLINRLLGRRTQTVKGSNILGNVVRFQLRIDAASGNILIADAARGKGGTLDPFFDMKRI
jgi:hypothetical protein